MSRVSLDALFGTLDGFAPGQAEDCGGFSSPAIAGEVGAKRSEGAEFRKHFTPSALRAPPPRLGEERVRTLTAKT